MSTLSTSFFALTPEAFWKWGRGLLAASLVFGLLLLALIAWKASYLAPFFPLVLIAFSGALYLFKRPTLNLYVALAGFVLITGYSEGLQIQEALYGMYFLAVLAHWFVRRVFFYRDRLIQAPEDAALLFFLLYAGASAGWGFAFGAEVGTIIGEALVLVMLAFYFPIKEVCARSPRGTLIVL